MRLAAILARRPQVHRGRVISLNERVQGLREKLNKRRLLTMQLLPDETEAERGQRELVLAPELAATRESLQEACETLWKTIYGLDPSMLNNDEFTVARTDFTRR